MLTLFIRPNPHRLAAVIAGTVCLIFVTLSAELVGDDVKPKQRWAIVATDTKSGGLADLLTAELSKWDEVELVEREQISLVLKELKLNATGLVKSDRSLQFGHLLRADALLLLESGSQPAGAKPKGIQNRDALAASGMRLRLVETRTSVRLLDISLPRNSLKKNLNDISNELKTAFEKLTVPNERRRLIGVMPIRSEEPGEFLNPFCRTLSTLIEVELNRLPQIVVLERSQLQRLTAESDLTGVELQLRGATRLLETGIRRADDGKGMIATCRLLKPGGGEPQVFQVTIDSREATAVRQKIITALERALGDEPNVRRPVALEDEAAVFDRRREWLQGAYRDEAASEMAEAALALAPTEERLSMALQQYHGFVTLLRARRHHELRLEWLRKTKPTDPLYRVVGSDSAFEPHVELSHESESDEEQRLRAEVDSLSLQIFDELYAEAAARPQQRFDLLMDKLQHSTYLSETGEHFVAMLTDVLDKCLVVMKDAGIKRDDDGQVYARLISRLADVVTKAFRQADATSGGTEYRVWKPSSLSGLGERLARYDEPAIRVASFVAQMEQPGKNGEQSAMEFLDYIKDWPVTKDDEKNLGYISLRRMAMLRLLKSQWMHEHVESLLQRVERQKDPSEVLRNQYWLFHYHAGPGGRDSVYRQRLLAILEYKHPGNQMGGAPGWRTSLREHLQHIGVLQPLVFTLDDAPGPWKQYTVKPIRLTNIEPKNFAVETVLVDRHADARKRGGELLFVWRRTDNCLGVERLSLTGGTWQTMGHGIPGRAPSFRGLAIAFSPDAMFAATDAPGFTIIRKDSIERITEKEGAPSNEVWQLAWFKDRLYVAFKDAFASFDPATKKFQLLASSVSVTPRNPIDSRGSFFVLDLEADEPQGCLWMTIQDNALPHSRNGFWRFQPDSNTYTKITAGNNWNRIISSWSDESLLLYTYLPQPWARLNHQSGSMIELKNYPKPHPSDLIRSLYFVKVGDHIVTSRGELLTPDGKTHRVQSDEVWELLQRAGPGFITHYDEKAKVLWYVEPK